MLDVHNEVSALRRALLVRLTPGKVPTISARLYVGMQIVTSGSTQPRASIALSLRLLINVMQGKAHAAVDIFPSSRYYTRDYRMFNAKAEPKIMANMSDTSLVKLRKKTFAEPGMQVTVYAKM